MVEGHTTAAVNRDLLFPQLNFEVTVPALNVHVGFFTQATLARL